MPSDAPTCTDNFNGPTPTLSEYVWAIPPSCCAVTALVANAPTPAPAPAAEEGNGQAEVPPVKGLGIAKGARPPGKKA